MIVTAQGSADAAGRAGWAGMRLLLEEKEAFVCLKESCSAVQLEAGGHRVLFTRAVLFPKLLTLGSLSASIAPVQRGLPWPPHLKQPLPQLPPRLPPVALSDSS